MGMDGVKQRLGKRGWWAILALWMLWAWGAHARPVYGLTPTPTPGAVAITAPGPQQALQGQVRVLGTTNVPDFKAAYLFFGYAEDPTHTWFLLAEQHRPTYQGLLARWDTTRITDGDYVLRLVVVTTDGKRYEDTVPVRVRNYTPIETPTPMPTQLGQATAPPSTPQPTITPTPHWPTPTPVPPNPVVLTPDELQRAVLGGIGAVLALLALFGFLRRVV